MKIDLSFWRFVIVIGVAKSFLWCKGEDTYLFHIGTFSRNNDTALKIIVLSVSFMIGFVRFK